MEDASRDSSLATCAVLGGRGFVGRSLVARLLRLGGWIVRVADSSRSPQLDPNDESDSLLARVLSSGGATYHHVDVRDKSQILAAIEGASVVFFMEPSTVDGRDFFHSYKVIVQGAKNVINACRDCQVRRLIYNSSADVVFDGSQDIRDGDESLSCPWKFHVMSIDLKAQAEALVLYANGTDGLLTCALRPSNIFGPGDPQLVPFLVHVARSGWAKFIIGNGENMSDFTYVENVAHALICAAEALDSRADFVVGKAFFITNTKPIKFWDFVSNILEALGYERPSIRIPAGMVFYIFLLLKWTSEKLKLRIDRYLDTAHCIIQSASRTRTYNCIAAKRHLGYSPVISQEEGIATTVKSFSNVAKDSSLARYGDVNNPSKADKLLGGGKVSDLLLWRDEKQTFACFLVWNILLYWFSLYGRTVASSVALLLAVGAVSLYGYGNLPSNVFGVRVRKMYMSEFEMPESFMRDSLKSMARLWNRGARNIKSLIRGGDWNAFFKVVFPLYLLKLVTSLSASTIVFAAMAFSFTGFFVYEQYESEMDQLGRLLGKLLKGMKLLLTKVIPDLVHHLYAVDNESDQTTSLVGGVG